MTDLEKFIALYAGFGIEVQVEDVGNGIRKITLEAKTHEKLVGYTGFCTDVYFGKDGEFIEQGFYE